MITLEQLKEIIPLLQSLGENTKELAFFYLGSIYFSVLLRYIVTFFFLFVLLKITSKIIESVRLHHHADSLVRDIRDILKIGSPGMLTENETNQVAKKIFSIIYENKKREKEFAEVK